MSKAVAKLSVKKRRSEPAPVRQPPQQHPPRTGDLFPASDPSENATNVEGEAETPGKKQAPSLSGEQGAAGVTPTAPVTTATVTPATTPGMAASTSIVAEGARGKPSSVSSLSSRRPGTAAASSVDLGDEKELLLRDWDRGNDGLVEAMGQGMDGLALTAGGGGGGVMKEAGLKREGGVGVGKATETIEVVVEEDGYVEDEDKKEKEDLEKHRVWFWQVCWLVPRYVVYFVGDR